MSFRILVPFEVVAQADASARQAGLDEGVRMRRQREREEIRRGRRLALAVLAAAVASAAAAPAMTADANAIPVGPLVANGPKGKNTGWHSWRPAGPEHNEELRSVAARGPADAWAVGYRQSAEAPGVRAPVAEHFDGKAWRATSVPGHAGSGQLDAVLPLSARDVWAVGSWNDAPAYNDRSLAEHFDGKAWREVPLPEEPANRSAYPTGLAAVRPHDVWAVGFTAEERVASPRPLAYRWNGRVWSSVATPDTGGDALLQSAAADGAGGVWAVGVAYDAEGAGHPLTEHWDGNAWKIVDAPHTAGRGEELESVAVIAPDDIWAVGGSGTPDGASVPLALHWNGRTWTSVPVPVPRVAAVLHSVSADKEAGTGTDKGAAAGAGARAAAAVGAGSGVWAVGEQQGVGTPAFTMRWDGKVWRTVPAATDPAVRGGSLFDVATVPNARPGGPKAWAVGSTLPQLKPSWRPVIEGYGPAPTA
ncbi:hypothetical protein [Streptomyces sp. NPDC088400]|uniref:hypothetical protein n=1 Tax=Streptomyces sp. NPDC088400 TaxID=3365861 RepID=UPI00382A937C